MRAQGRVVIAPPSDHRRGMDRQDPRRAERGVSWVSFVAPNRIEVTERAQPRSCCRSLHAACPYANALESTEQMLPPSQKERGSTGDAFRHARNPHRTPVCRGAVIGEFPRETGPTNRSCGSGCRANYRRSRDGTRVDASAMPGQEQHQPQSQDRRDQQRYGRCLLLARIIHAALVLFA